MLQQGKGEQNMQQFAVQTDVRIGLGFINRTNQQNAVLQRIHSKNKELRTYLIAMPHPNLPIQPTKTAYQDHQPHNCFICGSDMKSISYPLSDCSHQHLFCKSCLQQYTIYYSEQLNKVYCPFEGCSSQMMLEGKFYKSLPIQIQTKYSKINHYYSNKDSKSLKMCQKEGCIGQIELNNPQQLPQCNLCLNKLCLNCFLDSHQGQCIQMESQVLQKASKYRKCPQCGQVINNFQDETNRLSCICQYQFCYVCRKDWESMHEQDHDQNGVICKVEGVLGADGESQKKCGGKACFYITLIPRIILSLVIFAVLIALFGVVIVMSILTICCFGKRKHHYTTAANRRHQKEANHFMSEICGCYFQLFGKVGETLLTY